MEADVQGTSPATILVVDDDPLNRRLLVRALHAEGHRTVEAGNGVEALEALVAEQPDVMLLDVLMPELDGFGVLIAMKDLPAVSHIPVVMISSLEDQAGILRCIELGADDFLPKPADAAILRARVNAGLNKKRLHDLQRRHLRDVFTRFLPEAVVDEVMAEGGVPNIGAQRQTATVMFNDLRGFTAFAETQEPELVIEVLNRYLGLMGDAVLDHGGTLVTYLGDGMMSVFGAPIGLDDHADRAIAAARLMSGPRLAALNEWLQDAGLPHAFRMGVGIHSGTLMSGNVGSERRLEYTVIGDTVNVASRLCSNAKAGEILISDPLYQLTKAKPPVDAREPLNVKNRAQAVPVWSVRA